MSYNWSRDSYQLTREQLYDLVWSEAMWRLCKHFGITDVGLAKHCRKVGVPLPKRGYWNKLQAGHKVTKTPLPERDLATVNLITMSGTMPPGLRERIKGDPGVSEAGDDDIEVLTARFRKRLGKVTVPRDFTEAHPTIVALLKKDDEYRQASLTLRFPWNQPRFDAPFERRRLRFLNDLFLGFGKVGGSAHVRGDNARELAIYVGNASVSFELDRPPKAMGRARSTAPADDRREKLRLMVSGEAPGVTSSWEDQDGLPLEKQITEIIVGMLVVGEHQHRRWIEKQAAWERERREEEERAAIKRREEAEQRERERLAAIEKAKLDVLLSDAAAWRTANNLRDYVTAVRRSRRRTGSDGRIRGLVALGVKRSGQTRSDHFGDRRRGWIYVSLRCRFSIAIRSAESDWPQWLTASADRPDRPTREVGLKRTKFGGQPLIESHFC